MIEKNNLELEQFNSLNTVKELLEDMLLHYEGFFVTKSDKRILEEYRQDIISILGERKDWTDAKKLEYRITKYDTGTKERDIIMKVKDHAEYRKTHNDIRYKIDDIFLSSEELVPLIKAQIANDFTFYKNKEIFHSYLEQLDAGSNLSAKQIVVLERSIRDVKKRESDKKAGIIYFNPSSTDFGDNTERRIIHYALGRGKIDRPITEQDLKDFKDAYMRGFEPYTCNKLRNDFKNTMRPNSQYLFTYLAALDAIEVYLKKIDFDKHDVYGLVKAVPKIIESH